MKTCNLRMQSPVITETSQQRLLRIALIWHHVQGYADLWKIKVNTWRSPRCVLSSPWCTPPALSYGASSPLHLEPSPRCSLGSPCCWVSSCGVGSGDEAARGSVRRALGNSGWTQTLPLRWSRTLVAVVSTGCCWTLRMHDPIVYFSFLSVILLQPLLSIKWINEPVNMRHWYCDSPRVTALIKLKLSSNPVILVNE